MLDQHKLKEKLTNMLVPYIIGNNTAINGCIMSGGGIFIGNHSLICVNCFLEPLVSIGNHTVLGMGTSVSVCTHIGNNVRIGSNVNIGESSLIESLDIICDDAVLMQHVHIGQNTTIGEYSVICEGASIGADCSSSRMS